jgi:hypothetical protein
MTTQTDNSMPSRHGIATSEKLRNNSRSAAPVAAAKT